MSIAELTHGTYYRYPFLTRPMGSVDVLLILSIHSVCFILAIVVILSRYQDYRCAEH